MKQGYKQTEIGIIPEDWEVSKVQHQANVIDSLHSTPSFSDDGYSMVRVTDIKTGNLSLNDALKVSKNVFDEFTRNYKPKRNDIVVSRVGSYGVSSFVETNEPFCMGQNTVVIDSKLPPRFLYYVLNSTSTQQQIEGESYGSGYKSLSLRNIKELSIPIPPKQEQTAIATALSDIDALIGELDKLIAKKQGIKQATMQQLLTGKKRLAGFSSTSKYKQTEIGIIPEDWDEIYLSDAVDFLDGKRRPIKSSDRVKMNGVYPYYGASGVIDYVNDYIFDDDLILLGEDGENILSRNLPLAFQVKGKIWVNNHAHVLKPKENFDICFLTNYLESLDYSLHNSGTAQPKLNKQSCLKLRILAPKK